MAPSHSFSQSIKPLKHQAYALVGLWRQHLCFALLWTVGIGACVSLHFYQSGWFLGAPLLKAVAPFIGGAFLGGYCGLFLACILGKNRPLSARFCLCFILLGGASLAATLAIFILQHRLYFSQWHAGFLTLTWIFQFIFTAGSSFLLFLLTALRPLIPFALLLLCLASYAFSRGSLPGSR